MKFSGVYGVKHAAKIKPEQIKELLVVRKIFAHLQAAYPKATGDYKSRFVDAKAERRFYRYLRIGVASFGILLTFSMIWRAQLFENQLNLLARGYLFAKEGQLIPYGNPMTGGGMTPGIITSLMVGLPLQAWFNYHSPEILLWILQVVGYLLLDNALKEFLSVRARAYFSCLYWLSPWHIFFSVYLLNPNYLYFFAALHLWTTVKQRLKPNMIYSFLHVVAIGAAIELQASAFILVIFSLLLWWYNYFRVSWVGVIAGSTVILATLLPWLIELQLHPEILPQSAPGSFVGHGLLLVYPFFRGILYFLKIPTYCGFYKLYQFNFESTLGAEASRILQPAGKILGNSMGAVTMLLAVISYCSFLRRAPIKSAFAKRNQEGSKDSWFLGMIILGLTSVLICFALCPTQLNPWDVIVVHWLSAIPIVLFLERWATKKEVFFLPFNRFFGAFVPCCILILLAIGVASPFYQPYGHRETALGNGAPSVMLKSEHLMFSDLGLLRDFEIEISVDGTGYWPDVFPVVGGKLAVVEP